MAAGTPVVVLGHDLWQRRFSGDRTIAGRSVTIDGAPHTVVGVMPSDRGYPSEAEVWRPLRASEREDNDRELSMVGRLRSEMTVARASTEFATLAQVAPMARARRGPMIYSERTSANVSAAIQALFAAAMLTLLIACANVAALVGARGADRAGEIAVRGALGATRARVLGQLITESLVLALAGGALGLLFGRWALDRPRRDGAGEYPAAGGDFLGWPGSRRRAGRHYADRPGCRRRTCPPPLAPDRIVGTEPRRVAAHDADDRTAAARLVLAQIAIAVVLTVGADC